jgi:hypothetical protein
VSNASIDRRLAKLEGRRRPDGALFFMLWGTATGDLALSDNKPPAEAVVAAIWRGAGPPPPSRWIEAGGMEAREVDALMLAVETVAAMMPVAGPASKPCALSDEALIGIALAGDR